MPPAPAYARELTDTEKAAQAELVAGHISKAGHRHHHGADPRPAGAQAGEPRDGQIDAPGSVIVDLAAERGGNVELTQPGQSITTPNGVTIIGYQRAGPGGDASASQLYAQPRQLPRDADRQERKSSPSTGTTSW